MTTNNALKTLLPMGSTPLEKQASIALAEALKVPSIVADLLNPDRCPVHLLPYLAWAFSVDKWDQNWTEAVKRIAIKESYQIHKHKGTISAVKRVVQPIGYLMELKEWWQESPQGEAGTFSMTIEVPESGLNESTYQELVRLVDDAKPISRKLKHLAIAVTPTGEIHVFTGLQMAEIISVYPQ
ncbi:phage tail protein [Pasteurellaceae bacterium Macca]|nr:phage tail protein [Pasteurellaceae bacterium Macca]